MRRRYQTQGGGVNGNRWHRKSHFKKEKANNAGFHFREQRGQAYLPSPPEFSIPVTLTLRDPMLTHQTHGRRCQIIAANRAHRMIKTTFIFPPFSTVMQIVVMVVCLAGHEAFVCGLSTICSTNQDPIFHPFTCKRKLHTCCMRL